MRIQASWLLEALDEGPAGGGTGRELALAFPVVPRPDALVPLQRLGVRLQVNDPLPHRAVQLRTLLGGEAALAAAGALRGRLAVLTRPIELERNPFRDWLGHGLARDTLDHLFYWHALVQEIPEAAARDLLCTLVLRVLAYARAMARAGLEPRVPAGELLAYYLGRVGDLVAGGAPATVGALPPREFVACAPLAALVVCVQIGDDDDLAGAGEDFALAWVEGHGDLGRARASLAEALAGWRHRPGRRMEWAPVRERLGAAPRLVLILSSQDLHPGLVADEVVVPAREVFSTAFAHHRLLVKTVDARDACFDHLLIFGG